MKVAVPAEIRPAEKRVALIPDTCKKLVGAGWQVAIQSGAGAAAGYPDDAYQAAGATLEPDARTLLAEADVVLKVQAPTQNEAAGAHEVDLIRPGACLIAFLDPLIDHDMVRKLAKRPLTGVSMELIPRITRAQSMDALSSMANIAGYKAVLVAAAMLPKMFPMMMTAAGTISPARVFVIGAGVAGLQAIATAKRLGAVVSGYDVRPVVKEQVESLGAKFVEIPLPKEKAEDKGGYARQMSEEFLKKQRELMARVVAESDAVITTAAIPGKKSPLLVTADMVRGMRPGSVIVDLAAERGGNCELSRADETVVDSAVTIVGPTDLPSTLAFHASQMYSRNISTLLLHLSKDGQLAIDMNDEITAGCVVTREGKVVNPRVRGLMGMPEEKPPAAEAEPSPEEQAPPAGEHAESSEPPAGTE